MNSLIRSSQGRDLAFYMTAEHRCSYLENRSAKTLFVDPTRRIDTATYQDLVDQGFRRSGALIYRPACRGCTACVPVRIPVRTFLPDRSQRRNWKRNAPDFVCRETPAVFDPAHFALYRRYLMHRHIAGGMTEDASEESYRRFLVEPWGGATRFVELRRGTQLVGVAVTDLLDSGLSAVYTFFDPDLCECAPGVFAILSQIELTKRLGLPYLYLGYWIAESRKMAYKARFRPFEIWDGRCWTGSGHELSPGSDASDKERPSKNCAVESGAFRQ